MTFVESSTKAVWLSLKALRRQDDFRWKLYETRTAFVESASKAGSGCLSLRVLRSRMAFIESSTKAGWLSFKALRRQDDFRLKLYESRMAFVESSTNRMAFVESSTKAGSGCLSLRSLRKQDGFSWKLYESRLAFVESSTKAGWLSLKALQKQDQDDFRSKLCESRSKRTSIATILSFATKRRMLGVLPFVEEPDLSVSAARALAQHLPPCHHMIKLISL